MRTVWKIFARDLGRLLRNPVALVVALGVCAIPSVYAWLNILANWDPYENTGTVPIAVVVEDEGADVPGMGRVDAGQMVHERLEENHQLGWTFVDDEASALDGVRAGRYYAAFVIPPDFTSSLASVLEGRPEPARVGYYVNEKANAVAPKVTDTGATTLETQVADEFVTTAGAAVAERLQGAVGAAADGVEGTRDDAETALRDAATRLESLADGVDGALGSVGAAREATARARETLAATSDAASSLAEALDAATGSLGDARARARDLARDLDESLGAGADALASLSSRASQDVGRIAGDVGWAQGRLDAALSQARAANDAARGLADPLSRARDAVASLEPADEAQRALQQQVVDALDAQIALVGQLTGEQASRLDELQGISDEVSAGAESVAGLASSVNDAIQSGAGSLGALRSDLAADAMPGLSSALDALAASGGRAAAGAEALVPVIDQADGTLQQLDGLLGQCRSSLGDVSASLRDSAARLGSLADDLAAVEGARTLPVVADALSLDPSSTGEALGSPVEMVADPVFPVSNYGSGVAPFYTNLALWVGGFVLVAVYKLEVDREGLEGLDVTPARAFFGRWLLLATLGQVQALVCCAGDLALGIQCVSPPAFVLAGMVASLVYVLVVYALAVSLKHVGKALAVLLVVLQIPGASGLYPIQMQPAFFQALEPWLPFTYGIAAMREAVAGFYDGYYAHDLLVLLLFVGPALILGIVVRKRLLGVNALFDRRMGETGLLVTERDGEAGAGGLGLVVDALATSPAHRDAFLARAARFELAYPRRARRGLIALVCAPIVLLALVPARPGRLALLSLWVAVLVGASGYLIGLEYVRERLRERAGLAQMSHDELLALVAGAEKNGGKR